MNYRDDCAGFCFRRNLLLQFLHTRHPWRYQEIFRRSVASERLLRNISWGNKGLARARVDLWNVRASTDRHKKTPCLVKDWGFKDYLLNSIQRLPARRLAYDAGKISLFTSPLPESIQAGDQYNWGGKFAYQPSSTGFVGLFLINL